MYLKLCFYLLLIYILWRYRIFFVEVAQRYSIKHLEMIKIKWDQQISELIISYSLNGEHIDLPSFKFYRDICFEVINYAMKWGFPYKENLLQLRNQAQKDFLFTLRNLKFFWQSISQFMVIILITWIFRYAIVAVVKIPFITQTAIIIITLEVAGTLFFTVMDILIKKKKLLIYEPYFYSLYLFKGLISLNMPFQVVCERARIIELINKEDKFHGIRQALKVVTENVIHHGGEGISERIELICDELRYKQEQDFDETHKIMNVFKLVTILFFFFPAYLLNIHEILNSIPF